MKSHRFEIAASILLSEVASSHDDPGSCALNRIRLPSRDGLGLVYRAVAIGFTETEAWDIMSGWDKLRGSSLWESGSMDINAPGYELGKLARDI